MDPSIASGTEVAGYVIEERIGSGGFGEVYRATHPVIKRTVAIKVLHAKYSSDIVAVTRFISEARSVNQILHPNIVEVFAFGSHQGRELFVMELLVGKTLRAVLDERTRVPLAEAVPLLRGVADAVDAAHAAGIAHRDLKPENVFVLADGRVKLIDFGIAKLQDDNTPTLTETGSMLGTPQYMSPEQCRGRTVDLRTDQYSFGALAYHVLVGEPPFSGDPIEIALHHLNDRPVPPSKRRKELPPEVDRAILALLAKDPSERPSSCAVAVAAISGERTLKLRWSRRTKLRLVGVPIALAVVAAAVVAWPRRGDDVVAANGCPAGLSRLDGVWDPITRVQTIGWLYSEQTTDPWHGVVWRDALADVDAAADRWSIAWDRACSSPDRASDPLLYGERVTCLENALLDLQSASDALRSIDREVLGEGLPQFDITSPRARMLADCESERVLRAQVPAPPAKRRVRIAELLRDGGRTQMETMMAFGRRDSASFDSATDRLATIANEVESLDPPSAAPLIASRAWIRAEYAFDTDIRRRPAARKELLDGIARIERSGDAVAIAQALLALAVLELVAGDGDAIAKVDALIPKVEAAVARAGEPAGVRVDLALVRGQLAMRRGRYADAIEPLRFAVEHGYRANLPDYRRMLYAAMIGAGRGREAAADAHLWFEAMRKQYGSDVALPAPVWFVAVHVDDANGDLETALATRLELEKVITPTGGHQGPWGRLYRLDLEIRLGQRPADADAAIRMIAGKGTTPHSQNRDGPSTARRAGMFEVFAYATNRDGITGDDERADNAAILAFERGDRATALALAAKVAATCAARPCGRFLRFSRWIAAAGTPATVDTTLAALESAEPDPFATTYTGIVLAWLGRWTDAKAKLEAARAEPNLWESQADLVELDAWLGLARIRAGEREGARRLFEEALAVMSIWRNGFDGFSYMTPTVEVALADLVLPDDPARARRLVEHAIKGFARLGSFKDRERAEAQRWLDQHNR